MSNSNKGNTGAGRKRRSIQANLLAVINSVAVITALLSTCHFIFVPSMQPQQDPFQTKKENPIQKLLNKRRGKNNGTELASVASIIEDTTADSEQPAFDFGDDDAIDDDDDDGMFSNRKTNETKSFWEALKENLGRKEKSAEGEEKTPTSGLRKSAKAPP